MSRTSGAFLLFLSMLWPLGVFAQEEDGWGFVPGDKLLLFDNFADMPRGAAPPHWKVRGAAVRLVDGRLTIGAGSSTRMTPNITKWPNSFTVEMNVQAKPSAEDALRNVTWVFENGDAWVWQATLTLHANGQCSAFVEIADPGENSRAACNWLPAETNSIALWFQDDRLRIYVNGQRLIDMNQLRLSFQTASLMVSADALPVSFGAFRIAQSTTDVSTMALAGGQTAPAIKQISPVAENLNLTRGVLQDSLKKSPIPDTTLRPELLPADLIVSAIQLSPNPIAPGDQFLFKAIIYNQGQISAPDSCLLAFLDGSPLPPVCSGTALQSGQRKEIGFGPMTAFAGTHQIRVLIDSGKAIAELNEDNNEGTISFAAQPDFSWEAAEVMVYDSADANRVLSQFRLPNNGTIEIFDYQYAKVVLKAKNPCSQTYAYVQYEEKWGLSAHYPSSLTLSANSVTDLSRLISYPLGDTNVEFVLNSANGIAESDLSNNTFHYKVTKKKPDQPDVWLTNFSLSTKPLVGANNKVPANTTYNLSWAAGIRNPLVDNYSIDQDLYIDGAFIKRMTSQISGQGNFHNFYPVAFAPGHHIVKAVADPEKRLAEFEEDNNTVILELDADPSVTWDNLIAWSFFINGEGLKLNQPNTATIRDELPFQITIANEGPTDIPPVKYSMIMDGTQIDEGMTGVINGFGTVPNAARLGYGSVVKRIPFFPQYDVSHRLRIVLDPQNQLKESSEADNSSEYNVIFKRYEPLPAPDFNMTLKTAMISCEPSTGGKDCPQSASPNSIPSTAPRAFVSFSYAILKNPNSWPVNCALYVDGILHYQDRCIWLTPTDLTNPAQMLFVPGIQQKGTHSFRFEINGGNFPFESNSSDNAISGTFQVY